MTVRHDDFGNPVNTRGKFEHRKGDDDSSAVTFWGKQDLRLILHKAIAVLDQHYAAKQSNARSQADSQLARELQPHLDEIGQALVSKLGGIHQILERIGAARLQMEDSIRKRLTGRETS